MHRCLCALLEEKCGLSCTVCIRNNTSAGDLNRNACAEIDRSNRRVVLDHYRIGHHFKVLPLDIFSSLKQNETLLFIIDHKRTTTVNRHVEFSVRAAQRRTKLWMS